MVEGREEEEPLPFMNISHKLLLSLFLKACWPELSQTAIPRCQGG